MKVEEGKGFRKKRIVNYIKCYRWLSKMRREQCLLNVVIWWLFIILVKSNEVGGWVVKLNYSEVKSERV